MKLTSLGTSLHSCQVTGSQASVPAHTWGHHQWNQLSWFNFEWWSTCFPYLSVSQFVTQFCLVTFLQWGTILTWGTVLVPWNWLVKSLQLLVLKARYPTNLLTSFLHKQLGGQLGPVKRLGHHPHAALSVGDHLALCLDHVSAHVLLPLPASLHEHGVALLVLQLHPLYGLEGGHVNTKLLKTPTFRHLFIGHLK